MDRDEQRLFPIYDFRVEDLRQWHVVEAICFRCRHTEVVRHDALTRGARATERLTSLFRKLKCASCEGNRPRYGSPSRN